MPDPSRLDVVVAGHRGDVAVAAAGLTAAEPSTRAAALGALARLHRLDPPVLLAALADPDRTVRRRACELAPAAPPSPILDAALVATLRDDDAVLAELGAWALGERHQLDEDAPPSVPPDVVAAVAAAATGHADPLCREAAVAALGAMGHPDGLEAILAGTRDKATVRRRAVLALAAFDGPDVTAALERARADRDWQVRQAAEDLLREGGD
jgi:HEAT repeat protein